MKKLLVILALLFAPFAMAGHKYLPDAISAPPRMATKWAKCIQPVDILKEVRKIYPDDTFLVQPLFRAEEAKMFARLVEQEGAYTFYVLTSAKSQKWLIFPANKARCVLMLDGSNATPEKFAQIRGKGAQALKDMAMLITEMVKEEKRLEPTI